MKRVTIYLATLFLDLNLYSIAELYLVYVYYILSSDNFSELNQGHFSEFTFHSNLENQTGSQIY